MAVSTTRVTLDIPKDMHRKVKAIAALLGVSLKDFILDCVEEKAFKKEPKASLKKALRDAYEEKDLISYDSLEEFAKKHNI